MIMLPQQSNAEGHVFIFNWIHSTSRNISYEPIYVCIQIIINVHNKSTIKHVA